jgi:hypothetical protein
MNKTILATLIAIFFSMQNASSQTGSPNLNSYISFVTVKSQYVNELNTLRNKIDENDVAYLKQKASNLNVKYDQYVLNQNSELFKYYSHYNSKIMMTNVTEYVALCKETYSDLSLNYDAKYSHNLYEDYVYLYSSYFSEDWFNHGWLMFSDAFLKNLESNKIFNKILTDPNFLPDDAVIFPGGDQSGGGDIKVLNKTTAQSILDTIDQAKLRNDFPFDANYFLDLLNKTVSEQHYVVVLFSY